MSEKQQNEREMVRRVLNKAEQFKTILEAEYGKPIGRDPEGKPQIFIACQYQGTNEMTFFGDMDLALSALMKVISQNKESLKIVKLAVNGVV